MSDLKALLEREERHYELPPGAFDRLEDLRDRRRRTKRITAVAFTLLLLAVAIGGAIVLLRSSERPVPASPPGAADWSQLGYGPGRTSSNPTEVAITTENVGQLHLAWKADLGRDVDTSPVVVDGVVYVGANHRGNAEPNTGGSLSAVDAETGEILWSAEGLAPPVSPPAVTDGIVLVGTGDGVSAFDVATGTERWTRPGPPGTKEGLAPAIAAGIAYVAFSPSGVAALDPSTGEAIWSDEGLDSRGGGIAVADGAVFVGGAQHLTAIDASSGVILWQRWHRYAVPMPLVTGGVVYADFHDSLIALDAASGSELWSVGLPCPSPSASEHGVVFVRADQCGWLQIHRVFARDASTGGALWTRVGPSLWGARSLSMANGVLYLGVITGWPAGAPCEVGIAALDASTGKNLWQEPLGTCVSDHPPRVGGPGGPPAPAISDGVVYLAGYGTHELLAFHL